MSEIILYFLARSDEFEKTRGFLKNIYKVRMDKISQLKTIIPNICIVKLIGSTTHVTKSVRHLNVRSINFSAAKKLSDTQNINIEMRQLIARFEKIDNSETFNFLLDLLVAEPEEFHWIK